MAKIQPDWRIVKVDQTHFVGEEYRKLHGIERCGTYYLIDANLHIYICSLTPCHEAFPMNGFVDYVSFEASEADEGIAEIELMETEELCTYFDTNILRNPSESAANYLPDREDEETEEEYQKRIPDEVREYLAGNPVGF